MKFSIFVLIALVLSNGVVYSQFGAPPSAADETTTQMTTTTTNTNDNTVKSAKFTDTPSSKPLVHLGHFTLEKALAYDHNELKNPDCSSVENFDQVISNIQEWVTVLSDPTYLQSDIDLLKKVRELIVQAKASFESVQDQFEQQTQQTQLVQLKSTSLQAPIETQVIHKVFSDQMNDIMSLIQELNTAENKEPSELSQLADSIIEAIDKLIGDLEDLQGKSAEFQNYITTLQGVIQNIRYLRKDCHGSTGSENTQDPTPQQPTNASDSTVSSGTLDDFTVKSVSTGTGKTDFIASSGTLGNTNNVSSGNLQLSQQAQNRNKKHSKRSHLSKNSKSSMQRRNFVPQPESHHKKHSKFLQ